MAGWECFTDPVSCASSWSAMRLFNCTATNQGLQDTDSDRDLTSSEAVLWLISVQGSSEEVSLCTLPMIPAALAHLTCNAQLRVMPWQLERNVQFISPARARLPSADSRP